MASTIFMNTRFPLRSWRGSSDQRTGIPSHELPPPKKLLEDVWRQKSQVPTTAIQLFRGIVLAQEGNHHLQHLQAGFAARKPVIFVFELDQLDDLVVAPKRAVHVVALIVRHHGVILAMYQEDGHVNGADILDRRDFFQLRVARSGDAYESVPGALLTTAVSIMSFVDPFELLLQVGNAGD